MSRVIITISLPQADADDLKARAQKHAEGNVSAFIRQLLHRDKTVTKSAPASPNQAT